MLEIYRSLLCFSVKPFLIPKLIYSCAKYAENAGMLPDNKVVTSNKFSSFNLIILGPLHNFNILSSVDLSKFSEK